jgi:hypothetical protein
LCFAGQAAHQQGVSVQHLEGIVQAVRQSAASTGSSFSPWSGTSTVKPTISGVGGVETGRNPENKGTPMQHLFPVIPRNNPLPHPSTQETG